MFPLHDDNPTELVPLVTLLLIGASVGVWVGIQGAGSDARLLSASVCSLGAIPAEVTGVVRGVGPCRLGGWTWQAILSSMFLHGSWMHLIGNMWFLWIFGNNVEDSMGHLRFLVFYVLAGVVAAAAHIASDPASPMPMVGASGAISAVMGAYLVLYPRAAVHTLLILVVFIRVVALPAWVLLGYWFLIQLLSSQTPAAGGGVAYWAHIGGFLTGVLLIRVFANRTLVDAKRGGVVLDSRDIRGGGWW